MREAAFVKQNKNKWNKFESVIQNNINIPPEELSSLYLEVTDHLSYAQTFYPNSNTLNYLNNLSARAHQKIYKSKPESRNRLVSFFTKEFPLEFYHYQKQLLIAFLCFVLFAIVGWHSASTDQSFVRIIMGDAYVNMTLENIKNNDPMKVYKEMGEMNMFLGITVNNIKVGLFAYVLGIFFGIGTIFITMKNAVMLGSFQYFFYEKGLLWESVRTIWIHGTIEISVIIVAASAGLILGKGILFPGTYSRMESFVNGVKAGLKVVLSTVPLFIVAGFLEGFITRHTEMPDVIAVLIISLSLAFILFYYVYYPIHLHKLKNKHA
ncbi:stage II sporulation protein M [Mesonia aestuariivivens]|uniref:Stage II sporulation protein M n=1 Tax=Mesonia aestuariivivens TaxID=2796128 RepID=A0ABS6VZ33_9FLAO|nr:stage II sporulation protein M [Mesonia aestuariivivens]MBW2960521.1 stage II sporulation protein M [Mesonia aestuariivivens]